MDKLLYKCPTCGAVKTVEGKNVAWMKLDEGARLVMLLINKSKILRSIFGRVKVCKQHCPDCRKNVNYRSFKKN